MDGLTSANARAAARRKVTYVALVEGARTATAKRWQAARWVGAEAAKFPQAEAHIPLGRLMELAAELNRMNAERRARR